ncbi:MAG: flavodoxin-dependent (E)-4-hydroxy-3-methylbut-2-enyl-diphosphate synthase [Eubacteriales bacterium]|nr:flavodoxin-dependent (E)-4-hydroxy-3-methylbut-2-enyl-diphosphate synthase [Eubacteriales bacterium]
MDYEKIRRKTRAVTIGSVTIGSGHPIAVQSMLNTDTADAEACIAQARRLEEAGCDIIRLTVPSAEHAETIYKMKRAGIKSPLVADIHFDYRAAIAAVSAGADKIRINPGNIGSDEKIKAVADECRLHGVPIRIGVNGGSLEKHILAKYGAPTEDALCESALYHASLLRKFDFDDIVISIKSSSPVIMTRATEKLAAVCDYPLHIGVTEAGNGDEAMIKSAAGIGALIANGIGDTVRVSLTDDPVKEVDAARKILRALGVFRGGYIEVVSCPTCGRTKIDLIPICMALKKEFETMDAGKKHIKVAVMGCVVNGPGESADADIGIAGGDGCAVLISRGKIIGKIDEKDIIGTLKREVLRLITEG